MIYFQSTRLDLWGRKFQISFTLAPIKRMTNIRRFIIRSLREGAIKQFSILFTDIQEANVHHANHVGIPGIHETCRGFIYFFPTSDNP